MRLRAAGAAVFAMALIAVPAYAGDVLATAREDWDLERFCALIDEAGLSSMLTGPGPVTVFAPVNEAFDSVEGMSYQALRAPQNHDQLRAILLRHIVRERISIDTAEDTRISFETAGGDELTLLDTGDIFLVGGVPLIDWEIEADNGLIHVLDQVLPESSMIKIN